MTAGIRLAVWAFVSILALPVQLSASSAAELKIFTSRAVATVLEKVGPEFERNSGHKLNVVVDLSPNFVRRINSGEQFDLLVSLPAVIERLSAEGKLRGETRTALVKSGTGVEVRKGAKKPDIVSVEAFKTALLEARSVGYLPTSGIPELVERLGLADQVKPKAFIPNADIVSEKVAEGEVELGIVVMTQILTTPGVEMVGPLPKEIQIYVSFDGAAGAQAANLDGARQLLRFLKLGPAVEVLRSQGMEPG